MKTSRIARDLEKISDWPGLAQEAGYCSYRLANLLDLQEKTLRRYFQKKFGRPTRQQLELMRQKKIEEMAQAGMSEKEIAVELRFKYARNLSRRFKDVHGITMRVWLRSTAAPTSGSLAFIMSTIESFIPL